MEFFDQFEQFDPKEGAVPYFPFSLLPRIVRRARSMLSARTREEIVKAAQIIEWMIEAHFEQARERFIQDQLQWDGWACKYLEKDGRDEEGLRLLVERGLPDEADPEEYFDFAARDNTSEVDALKDSIDAYDLDSGEFKGAQQHEYFAVMALWLVADCLQWLRHSSQASEGPSGLRKMPADNAAKFSLAGQSALLAMDAVGYAEHLIAAERHYAKVAKQDNEIEGHKQKIDTLAKAAQIRTEKFRAGAYKSHRDDYADRAEVIKYYEEQKGNVKSAEDGARQIVAAKLVLAKHRAIARWLSEHFKAKSIQYYEDQKNEFKSVDEAAQAIAGNLVPATPERVAIWINEYLKSPSASRV
ncbi:MAG: hypothetical protein ACLPXB_13455 [Thiobacillaceae bacterium]